MSQFIFDATPESRLRLGNLSGQGYEVPSTKLCIDVTRCRQGETSGEIEVVQLWLTVPQMAEIVKHFFWEVVSPGNIYTKLLGRLLHRRRQVMTSDLALARYCDSEGRDRPPWMPQYHKLEV